MSLYQYIDAWFGITPLLGWFCVIVLLGVWGVGAGCFYLAGRDEVSWLSMLLVAGILWGFSWFLIGQSGVVISVSYVATYGVGRVCGRWRRTARHE